MVSLSSPNFWRDIKKVLGIAQNDSGVDYVVMDHGAEMNVIVRTAEELFSSTVSTHLSGMHVVVNGNYFGLTTMGKVDVAWGHDPVPAADTLIEGRVVSGGGVIAGDSRPLLFWFGQVATPKFGKFARTYQAGAGDPPLAPTTVSAIGGVGPLIIDGLQHGAGNEYRKGAPAAAPLTGAPSAAAAPFLSQRNNATFVSAETRPVQTGKTILASHSANRMLLVAVQPNAVSPGMSYTAIRDTLVTLGFDQAVFLDGSDSAFMTVGGRWLSSPGANKDEGMVVGIGFKWHP
jgi:hypothetical protein